VAERISASTGTPFVFLSAYDDQQTVNEATEQGAFAYLVKPIEATQMLPTIEAALRRAADYHILKEKERRLNMALSSDRRTSMAVGLIMERYRRNSEDAFEMLRRVARSQRRKLHDVAAELIDSLETVNRFGETATPKRKRL
jgi:response regulator NasT